MFREMTRITITTCCMLFASIRMGHANENLTMADLPSEIVGEITDILNGVLLALGQCGPLQPDDYQLLLHTRSNIENSIILNISDPIQIQPGKKTILITHGWISNVNGSSIPEMKDAFLLRYDANVVLLDWSIIAYQLYTTAACVAPAIADVMADFLFNLEENFEISIDSIHLVGHSVGAQMFGRIGQFTKSKYNKTVGRITALDPAGPLYFGTREDQRLDKNDAKFVQVIHTNGGVFGYLTDCGDLDFYVNCGIHQNGCPDVDLTNLLDTLVSVVGCSHSRSHEYFAESILTDQFRARSCENCPFACIPDLLNAEYVIMGEDAPNNATKDAFWIPTNAQSPFALGCEGSIVIQTCPSNLN